HNENDEPAFTQPAMYRVIDQHPSVRELYRRPLEHQGAITPEEVPASDVEYRARLDDAFATTHTTEPTRGPTSAARDLGVEPDRAAAHVVPQSTAVSQPMLERIVDALTQWPDDLDVHPKLQRQLVARRAMLDGADVDWSLAEAL